MFFFAQPWSTNVWAFDWTSNIFLASGTRKQISLHAGMLELLLEIAGILICVTFSVQNFFDQRHDVRLFRMPEFFGSFRDEIAAALDGQHGMASLLRTDLGRNLLLFLGPCPSIFLDRCTPHLSVGCGHRRVVHLLFSTALVAHRLSDLTFGCELLFDDMLFRHCQNEGDRVLFV